MTTAKTTTPTTKVCNRCCRELPIEFFRRRSKDGEARQGQCKACFSDHMRRYRQARRAGSVARFSAELRRARGPREVERLCEVMIEQCGGVQRLAEAWSQQFHAALREQPGGRSGTNALMAVCKLMEYRDARNPEPDLSDFTDEELADEVRRIALELGLPSVR